MMTTSHQRFVSYDIFVELSLRHLAQRTPPTLIRTYAVDTRGLKNVTSANR
jgi:hypothetical protein